METSYTDTAERALADYTELYSGDITGQTLATDLYKCDTGVLMSEGELNENNYANTDTNCNTWYHRRL